RGQRGRDCPLPEGVEPRSPQRPRLLRARKDLLHGEGPLLRGGDLVQEGGRPGSLLPRRADGFGRDLRGEGPLQGRDRRISEGDRDRCEARGGALQPRPRLREGRSKRSDQPVGAVHRPRLAGRHREGVGRRRPPAPEEVAGEASPVGRARKAPPAEESHEPPGLRAVPRCLARASPARPWKPPSPRLEETGVAWVAGGSRVQIPSTPSKRDRRARSKPTTTSSPITVTGTASCPVRRIRSSRASSSSITFTSRNATP